ncbi:hypothetical protein X943_001258 [Babesia divergens]|uniref:Uncharacterized protein n=1 Tax=Babesia divergens TaxID=32595 RepID=A0AAD9LK31_BABDI|nr:hypothetical protein X943_001258 [Babesia divergens]
MTSMTPSKHNPKDLQFWESYDHYNLDNPHVGVSLYVEEPYTLQDPRNLQHTQWNYCRLRYALFHRCCQELSEDNPRCRCVGTLAMASRHRYQYYRAEMACTQDFLDVVNKFREQGNHAKRTHSMNVLPSHQVHNLRQ